MPVWLLLLLLCFFVFLLFLIVLFFHIYYGQKEGACCIHCNEHWTKKWSTSMQSAAQVPPARSRFTVAVFRYYVFNQHGQNVCRTLGCSFYCELDGHPLKSCSSSVMEFQNLTANRDHNFVLNVSTQNGEKNSSSYGWHIDITPPTAAITCETTYTSAANITIGIQFTEACTGHGGFRCSNGSNCDVMISGPAYVDASTLQVVKPGIQYSLVIMLSPTETHGRVSIKMGDAFCSDEAGNLFVRTNHSILVVHLDRRLVDSALQTLVPSYELEIGNMPRTVCATNAMEKLKFFLLFSKPVANSTNDILNALTVNSGYFVPLSSVAHASRRFGFELRNVSRTDIITVELQSDTLIGRTGNAVSRVMPIVFLYDATRPSVTLTTSSFRTIKEANLVLIVEFTKPVFGFDASSIKVEGGTVARFKEFSKALYSVTIEMISQNVVSVFVPEGKVIDISGNPNLPSKQLEVRHYLVPAISVALDSFVTAGLLVTSLASTILALTSANLAAISTEVSNAFTSDPSRNLLGMVGHLQVFALSNWYSERLPANYSETIKGLRWLIPREKLPWTRDVFPNWPSYSSYIGSGDILQMSRISSAKNSNCTFARSPPESPQSDYETATISYPKCENFSEVDPFPNDRVSEFDVISRQHNSSIAAVAPAPPLNSEEYFIYFLRGEPLSAINVVRKLENYKGWQDLEMNLFWLGVCGIGFLALHFLVLLFLRWRTGTSINGSLSIPRFQLFLLILFLPCIGQSSAFIIRGNTTSGLTVGALLLAIPAAFILSIFLFLMITVFMGTFLQYKEVRILSTDQSYCNKLSNLFLSEHTIGRWFPLEGRPASFLLRFGILFEDLKGPPKYVSVAPNNPSSITKLMNSERRGIGRMRIASSDNSNGDATASERLLGCARTAYIVLDLLRRVGLGILAGAYSAPCQSQCAIAFSITMVQFLYLFILKPHISRGVHAVESISLLCETALFALFFYIGRDNIYKDQQIIGILMLLLLFLSFVSQLLNEWYAIMKCLWRLSDNQKPSFKLGLIYIAKGLVLPLLPSTYRSRFIPGLFQSATGLVAVVPPNSDTELENTSDQIAGIVIPVYSSEADAGKCSKGKQVLNQCNIEQARRLQDLNSDSKNEMKKLRELARASFSGKKHGRSGEGSSCCAPREHSSMISSSSDDSLASNRWK